MILLRGCLATTIFAFGIVSIIVFFKIYNWVLFLGSITCFTIAYYLWPSRTRGQRQQENIFLDILELIIELPVEIVFWFFRFLGRLFRDKDGGFDIDL